jgi:hypothetical protein
MVMDERRGKPMWLVCLNRETPTDFAIQQVVPIGRVELMLPTLRRLGSEGVQEELDVARIYVAGRHFPLDGLPDQRALVFPRKGLPDFWNGPMEAAPDRQAAAKEPLDDSCQGRASLMKRPEQ